MDRTEKTNSNNLKSNMPNKITYKKNREKVNRSHIASKNVYTYKLIYHTTRDTSKRTI